MTTKNLHNRKWLWLLGILGCQAMLTLSSCSSDDHAAVPEPSTDEVAITFSGSEAEVQEVVGARGYRADGANGFTRAGTPLSEKATDFDVWGYKNKIWDDTDGYTEAGLQTVMPAFHVAWQENTAATTTTNSSGWEYILTDYPLQTIKYWDFGAAAYRFFAATGYPVATTNTVDGVKVVELSIPADGEDISASSYYSHLWFSTGNAVAYPTRQFGKPVSLEFALPLARVRFILRTIKEAGLPEPVLEDIQYKPISGSIPVRGTFTVIYPLTGKATEESWTTSDFTRSLVNLTVPYTENVKFTQAEIDAAESGDPAYGKTTDDIKTEGTYKWYNVMPLKEQSAYMLSLRINGEEKSATVPAAYMSWLPGYQYTYIFKINEEGGVELESYNAAYSDWKEGTEADISVYNW